MKRRWLALMNGRGDFEVCPTRSEKWREDSEEAASRNEARVSMDGRADHSRTTMGRLEQFVQKKRRRRRPLGWFYCPLQQQVDWMARCFKSIFQFSPSPPRAARQQSLDLASRRWVKWGEADWLGGHRRRDWSRDSLFPLSQLKRVQAARAGAKAGAKAGAWKAGRCKEVRRQVVLAVPASPPACLPTPTVPCRAPLPIIASRVNRDGHLQKQTLAAFFSSSHFDSRLETSA